MSNSITEMVDKEHTSVSRHRASASMPGSENPSALGCQKNQQKVAHRYRPKVARAYHKKVVEKARNWRPGPRTADPGSYGLLARIRVERGPKRPNIAMLKRASRNMVRRPSKKMIRLTSPGGAVTAHSEGFFFLTSFRFGLQPHEAKKSGSLKERPGGDWKGWVEAGERFC